MEEELKAIIQTDRMIYIILISDDTFVDESASLPHDRVLLSKIRHF